MSAPTLDQARDAKQRFLTAYAERSDVVGVGITRQGEGYAVKVNLRAAPTKGGELPLEIDGVPVEVEVVGTIRKR